MTNQLSRRGFLSTLTAAALITSTATAFAGEGGGGGGRDAKPHKSKTTGNSGKKRKSKFAIYAETVEENYRKKGMGYYFASKNRMRRLLDRMHEEERMGYSDIRTTLMKIRDRKIGKKLNAKTYKPKLAGQVIEASFAHGAYKYKVLSEENYQKAMLHRIGFVP